MHESKITEQSIIQMPQADNLCIDDNALCPPNVTSELTAAYVVAK